MKILVLGASQGTGAPAKLDLTHPALTKVAGDFHAARADVANFRVDACESSTWVGKGVQLGG